MDIYQQQRMHYKNVMMINNEGVELLQNANIERAISTLQRGIILSRNLLLSTRAAIIHNMNSIMDDSYMEYPHRHAYTPFSVLDSNNRNSSSCYQYTALNPRNGMRSYNNGRLVSSFRRNMDGPNRDYVDLQECYEWLDMLYNAISTASSSVHVQMPIHHLAKFRLARPHAVPRTLNTDATATLPGVRPYRFGAPLKGMKTDDYYIHDRPFIFPNDFIEERWCGRNDSNRLIDTDEIIRAITVLVVNYALAYHYQGKIYGRTKSYTKAIDMYYLLWSLSQSLCTDLSPTYCINDRWHTTIQCIFLNNLVHIHNELECYVESNICITCLYDLIVWKSSQQGEIGDTLNDNECVIYSSAEITSERINILSYLEQPEFDQIMANIIYFQIPETARAA